MTSPRHPDFDFTRSAAPSSILHCGAHHDCALDHHHQRDLVAAPVATNPDGSPYWIPGGIEECQIRAEMTITVMVDRGRAAFRLPFCGAHVPAAYEVDLLGRQVPAGDIDFEAYGRGAQLLLKAMLMAVRARTLDLSGADIARIQQNAPRDRTVRAVWVELTNGIPHQ